MIQLYHVTKRYGGKVALDDVSLQIPRGEFAFLTGPSGAGKTTLLRLIFREEIPTDGQILVNGRNVASIPPGKIPYLRRTMGVVFQDFRLIQRKTVQENVSVLPRVQGLGRQEERRLALEALDRVGLADRADTFPEVLSGGEKQRVAIARALVNAPEILIADEPTGNLDPELSREIFQLFVEVNRSGTTVLVASHDPEMLRLVGGRILALERGRLAEDVTIPYGRLRARTDPEPSLVTHEMAMKADR